MNMRTFLVIATIALPTIAFAETPFVGKTGPLNFEVDSGRSQFTFSADTPAEKVAGTAKGINGSFKIADASNPETTSGTVNVPVAKMESGNNLRDEHMRGSEWLNGGAHPNITFVIEKVTEIKANGNKASGKAHGKFTLNGVTKAITAPVQIVYAADKNMVKVTTQFKVSLADHQIKGQAGQIGSRVSPIVDVTCTLFAAAK